jgi:hypothetical protein
MSRPVIHQTDLFHPHADPDDHWDLTCVYALCSRGEIDLRGVVIDYPPNPQYGNPAVCAVAQMNHITGLSVPVSIGAATHLKTARMDPASAGRLPRSELAAARFILDALSGSAEPVVIHSVGSSRDIALAGALDPSLFERQCAGVYLNAGTATNDPELRRNREYNVTLDPQAFRAMFDLPCPVYWLPCFHAVLRSSAHRFEAGTNGSVYSFVQKEILDDLAPEVKRYFLYMFERSADQRWLSYLHSPENGQALRHYGEMERRMWCTAGFLHSAGLAVDRRGAIVEAGEADGVFRFEPIQVECDQEGLTRWEAAAGVEDRFILSVPDRESYGRAMTLAMKSLLMCL